MLNNEFWQLRGMVWWNRNGDTAKRTDIQRMQDATLGELPGVPDLSFRWHGITFFLEVKAEETKGRLTGAQPALHAKWLSDCALNPVYVVWSVDEARDVVKAVMGAKWVITRG